MNTMLSETVLQAQRLPVPLIWWLTPICALVALVFAYVFYR
jgi:hypothetical protein